MHFPKPEIVCGRSFKTVCKPPHEPACASRATRWRRRGGRRPAHSRGDRRGHRCGGASLAATATAARPRAPRLGQVSPPSTCRAQGRPKLCRPRCRHRVSTISKESCRDGRTRLKCWDGSPSRHRGVSESRSWPSPRAGPSPWPPLGCSACAPYFPGSPALASHAPECLSSRRQEQWLSGDEHGLIEDAKRAPSPDLDEVARWYAAQRRWSLSDALESARRAA